jgi:hypothetical protein
VCVCVCACVCVGVDGWVCQSDSVTASSSVHVFKGDGQKLSLMLMPDLHQLPPRPPNIHNCRHHPTSRMAIGSGGAGGSTVQRRIETAGSRRRKQLPIVSTYGDGGDGDPELGRAIIDGLPRVSDAPCAHEHAHARVHYTNLRERVGDATASPHPTLCAGPQLVH